MDINLRESLRKTAENSFGRQAGGILEYLPCRIFDPAQIKAIMINEVVADLPENDFYSTAADPYYMQTTIPLFQKAGADIKGIEDIWQLGIYITSAVKLPKGNSTIDTAMVAKFLPLLEAELDLFDGVKAIMLMGDVAKKAFNMITKSRTGTNALPAVSTYKLRNGESFYKDIRIFPAYIMTGKNILIEKSKVQMSAEDIGKMLQLIG